MLIVLELVQGVLAEDVGVKLVLELKVDGDEKDGAVITPVLANVIADVVASEDETLLSSSPESRA